MNDATQFFDSGGGGYQIERSLRFNPPDSAYLSRTPGSAGNRKTWTWAGWVKKSSLAGTQNLFSNMNAGNSTGIYTNFATNLSVQDYASGTIWGLTSVPLYRDTSAWYHIVVAVDTTVATETDRVKLFVNGERIAVTGTYPGQDTDTRWNTTATITLGTQGLVLANYFSGYLADVYGIDGQALDPTSFGEFDDNGVWQPKAYSGSYGTNGFHLPFSDNSTAAALGTDTSGNGNTWTVNNISVAAGAGNDSLVDTPTNYGDDTGAGGEVRGNYATLNPLDGAPGGLDNGNLDATYANAYPTIIPGSGQWYYEVDGTGYTWDGTRANWTLRSGVYNFGQRAWTSSAPSGYKALCTTNLPEPTILDGSTAMDTVLYTGNGSTQTISGLEFSPDLVWLKNRAQADNHKLLDTVRGATEELESNTTDGEVTNADGLTAFNSDGFDLGADVEYNTSTEAYVAWTWDAGSSTVTNNDGTITSQVRANPSAGFSIVKWTGSGGTGSVGHGLNVTPAIIIAKFYSGSVGIGTTNWWVAHVGLNNFTGDALRLNETFGPITNNSYPWNNTINSSVFGVTENINASTNAISRDYIAYCFAPVEGYSAFGSYTGNGSVDGPFVSCNFRPRWVLLKASSTTGNWFLLDTARLGYNQDNYALYPNLSASFSTTTIADILSNGFKLRQSDISVNGSAQTYIYAAFAENPFKTSRAR
jgi:hypothetical protein